MTDEATQTEINRTIAQIDELVLSRKSYFPDGNIKPYVSQKLHDLGRKLDALELGDNAPVTVKLSKPPSKYRRPNRRPVATS